MLRDPHRELPPPPPAAKSAIFVRGAYLYRHYLDDGFDDVGWGCAFRTALTIDSWLMEEICSSSPPEQTPVDSSARSVCDIQATLDALGVKPGPGAGPGSGAAPWQWRGSSAWIGTVESAAVLAAWHPGARLRTLHLRDGTAARAEVGAELIRHFRSDKGGPVLVGGDGGGAIAIVGLALEGAGGEVRGGGGERENIMNTQKKKKKKKKKITHTFHRTGRANRLIRGARPAPDGIAGWQARYFVWRARVVPVGRWSRIPCPWAMVQPPAPIHPKQFKFNLDRRCRLGHGRRVRRCRITGPPWRSPRVFQGAP
jgi:hypothetical protein